MKKQSDTRRLDVRRFAEDAAELRMEEPLAGFPRLAAEAGGRATDEPVVWSARGEMLDAQHVQPQVWLHLQASTRLSLVCQRCLQPVQLPVEVERSFRFVADEATAAAQDDESEEDVLAESRSFDLHTLLEDELLMAIPLVPRHVICPVVLPASAGHAEFEAAQAQRENPFEVLARLKDRRH